MLKRAYLRVSDPDTDPTPTILNVLENFKEMPYNQSIKKKKQPTTTGITLSEHSTVFFVHLKVQEVGKVLIIYSFFKKIFGLNLDLNKKIRIRIHKNPDTDSQKSWLIYRISYIYTVPVLGV